MGFNKNVFLVIKVICYCFKNREHRSVKWKVKSFSFKTVIASYPRTLQLQTVSVYPSRNGLGMLFVGVHISMCTHIML